MASTPIPQHKRMAAGDKNIGFAAGGSVGTRMPNLGTAKARPPKPSIGGGMPESPLTVAKRNNGVVGMKKGGSCKK